MVKRAAESNSSLKKTKPKKSEKEPPLHKAIFKAGGLPDGTEVYYITPETYFPGKKQGFGIFCLCCKEEELPKDKWYCTLVCEDIHHQLKILLRYLPVKVPDYLLDLIRKKLKEGDADNIKNRDVEFVLIRGKKVKGAFTKRLLLRDAIKIFHEQFKPIIDKETKRDFIAKMANGSDISESVVFPGVYTAMLTVDSKVVTAGMFRVFGEATAELSIVATSEPYKQKGYFNVLFSCIEKLLSYLCIKKIVLPASVDAKTMWIEKFGFKNLTTKQMEEYRKTQPSMVAFTGTSLLEKGVPIGRRTFRSFKTYKLKL